MPYRRLSSVKSVALISFVLGLLVVVPTPARAAPPNDLDIVPTSSDGSSVEQVFSDAVSDIGPGLWLENPANGHGYTVTDDWSSFEEYEGQAVAWGGHLVTINDQAEQDWLYDNFGPVGYLIGLNDIEEEGSFVWVSGQPVGYTNWCSGEPNDYLGEDSVQISSGSQCWNDEVTPSGRVRLARTLCSPEAPVVEVNRSHSAASSCWTRSGSTGVEASGSQR